MIETADTQEDLDTQSGSYELAVAWTNTPDGDKVCVSVRDTGCGISEEARQTLFQPFFTTKKPGEGTGLGLAVSQEIARKHGGRIDVLSAVDEGSEFVIEIPIRHEARDR